MGKGIRAERGVGGEVNIRKMSNVWEWGEEDFSERTEGNSLAKLRVAISLEREMQNSLATPCVAIPLKRGITVLSAWWLLLGRCRRRRARSGGV